METLNVQYCRFSGIFCATALKALRRDYGYPIIVSHQLVKSLLKFQSIKTNNQTALPNFHQKRKITITWLKSIEDKVPIKSNDNLAKALSCLSCNMRNEF